MTVASSFDDLSLQLIGHSENAQPYPWRQDVNYQRTAIAIKRSSTEKENDLPD